MGAGPSKSAVDSQGRFPGAKITEVAPGRVLASWGPLNILVATWSREGLNSQMAREGALLALETFAQVAQHREVVRKNVAQVATIPKYPAVVLRMIEAVRGLGEPDFTAMAAVAGSIADQVADHLSLRGAIKVIADNGGDIALRLAEGQQATVGVRTDLGSKAVRYLVRLNSSDDIGGVATSGFGGRSLTKGIASAAVALAKTAAQADAAATLIGNFTDVDDPAIERTLAEKLDPTTDIRGHLVTAAVGPLPREKMQQALARGLAKARELMAKELIKDALIAIKELVQMTDPGRFEVVGSGWRPEDALS